jgi:glycosyltransferase involved in cell wall biosynthesis
MSAHAATRNRSPQLEHAIQSLLNQTINHGFFEIIVVDNGSVDDTRFVVGGFAHHSNIRYYYDPAPGLHIGRHVGFHQAKGEILVYVDDDIEAFPTMLSAIASAFEDPEVALVGGKCLPKHEEPFPEWLTAMWAPNSQGERVLWYLSLIDLGEAPRFIDPSCVFGCNFSIRRSVLLQGGGFHPDGMPAELIRFRGDGETYMSRYIATKGYKAFHHPEASVYHYVPGSRMTIEYLCQRAYNEGISASFASIRSAHGLDGNVGQTTTNRPGSLWSRARGKSAKEMMSSLRNRMRSLMRVPSKLMSSRRDMREGAYLQAIGAAYQEGFIFHQKATRRSEVLMEWVLRPNYWDAQVPDDRA